MQTSRKRRGAGTKTPPRSEQVPARQPAAPTEASPAASEEQSGKSPLLFALLFFGLPLVLIVLIEAIRQHA